jgi:uncharacterized membrane protein
MSLHRFFKWNDLPLASKLAILFVVLTLAAFGAITIYNDAVLRAELLAIARAQNWHRARDRADD